MKFFSRWLIVLTIFLSGCMPIPTTPPIEPDAGSWPTWVVTDVAALLPAPPPDQAATLEEVMEVRALVAGQDEAALQQIAYWDSGSPSYRWIEIAFAQNRAKPAAGPRVTRMMSLLNVAIYDALVVVWDAKYTYNRARPAALAPDMVVMSQHTGSPSYPSEHAVAAGAASTVLSYIYPDLAAEFEAKAEAAVRSRLQAGANFPSDIAAGLQLGRQVAQMVIERAKIDDTLPAWDGVIPTGPGYWTGEKPAEPNAGKWQSWLLLSNDELRPLPPLAHDSPELTAELGEVQTLTRTVQTNTRALWWQSAEGTFESWYNFASTRMFEQGLDINPMVAARTYAMMSVAHYDALIACWEAKYTYWSFRPFQMDATTATVFPTPNYPSYPSGHACASKPVPMRR